MKKMIMVLMMLMVAVTAFAEIAHERVEKAHERFEKATAECKEAWDNLFNCRMMSLEEFTAEYKKNHFALNSYDNEWSASLSRAFKEYMAEVKQTQKELWNIYYEKE